MNVMNVNDKQDQKIESYPYKGKTKSRKSLDPLAYPGRTRRGTRVWSAVLHDRAGWIYSDP